MSPNAPVWYLQIWPGVRTHFKPRWIEWVMAIWLIVWGGNMILKPGDDFVTPSGAWNGLRYWFGEDVVFCWIMVLVGILGLVALTINGTFRDTFYARYSPLVRATTSFLGSLMWLAVWLSSLSASTQGAVAYWAPALIEMLTAYYVFGEFGETLRRYHDGRRNPS